MATIRRGSATMGRLFRSNGQRQVVVDPASQCDARIEGADQLVEQHLLHIAKALARRIRLERRVAGQRRIQDTRRPVDCLEVEREAESLVDLGLTLSVKDRREVVKQSLQRS